MNNKQQNTIVIEVCVDDVDGVKSVLRQAARSDAFSSDKATKGTVQLRVELCADLTATGGITPSCGLVRAAAEVLTSPSHTSLPHLDVFLHVMVRPRSGDFVYSADDYAVMLADADFIAAQDGVDGIVTGAMVADSRSCGLDLDFLAKMTDVVVRKHKKRLCLHRVIDMCEDPVAETRRLASAVEVGQIELHTVLTSGGCASAMAGANTLKNMALAAMGRFSLLPGCGVRSGNVRELISQLQRTPSVDPTVPTASFSTSSASISFPVDFEGVHFSARRTFVSPATFRNEKCTMSNKTAASVGGSSDVPAEYQRSATDESSIAEMIRVVSEM
eukprot:PhM_4_TR11505/c0_g1_i1/m.55701/K06201/cutC; copper homeostasis protein